MDNKGNPPPYSSYPAQAPPPMGFNPPPTTQQTFVVTQQPVIMSAMGPDKQSMTCPSCRQQIMTKVEVESSTRTHLIALLLCVIGCGKKSLRTTGRKCWPCCLIPYCMDSCQNKNHYCPSCQAFLGTYKS